MSAQMPSQLMYVKDVAFLAMRKQRCVKGEVVSNIKLFYACKLLFQELQSMNVATRLRLQDF